MIMLYEQPQMIRVETRQLRQLHREIADVQGLLKELLGNTSSDLTEKLANAQYLADHMLGHDVKPHEIMD